MNHRRELSDCRTRHGWLKAGIACLVLGTLGACGGGDGDSAIAGGAGASSQAARTTMQAARTKPFERKDPIIQSANPATMKMAGRKCIKSARAEAGDGAARKAMRQTARRESCEAEFQPRSNG